MDLIKKNYIDGTKKVIVKNIKIHELESTILADLEKISGWEDDALRSMFGKMYEHNTRLKSNGKKYWIETFDGTKKVINLGFDHDIEYCTKGGF